MGNKADKERKRKEKRKQIRAEQEAARRNKISDQATENKAHRISSPKQLIEELNMDVIDLMRHKERLRKEIDERVKFALEMHKKYPLKFNERRVEEFTAIQDAFKEVESLSVKLMEFIGKIDDQPTMSDKLVLIAENMNTLTDTQYEFTKVSRKMEEIDMKFHQDMQKLLNPKEILDQPTAEGDETPVDFQQVEQDGTNVVKVEPYPEEPVQEVAPEIPTPTEEPMQQAHEIHPDGEVELTVEEAKKIMEQQATPAPEATPASATAE